MLRRGMKRGLTGVAARVEVRARGKQYPESVVVPSAHGPLQRGVSALSPRFQGRARSQ